MSYRKRTGQKPPVNYVVQVTQKRKTHAKRRSARSKKVAALLRRLGL